MGLLDEAIREHLELKRRRGADPSEVARQQRAILDTEPSEEPVAELHADEPSGAPLEIDRASSSEGQVSAG
ncbi:MAG: hypothetical protein JO240_02320, partial [Solirubrobacterales bacterium]|nr:hypothetical protein [Solirubrobacterales bacterium]